MRAFLVIVVEVSGYDLQDLVGGVEGVVNLPVITQDFSQFPPHFLVVISSHLSFLQNPILYTPPPLKVVIFWGGYSSLSSKPEAHRSNRNAAPIPARIIITTVATARNIFSNITLPSDLKAEAIRRGGRRPPS
jgi:hypothetical protein